MHVHQLVCTLSGRMPRPRLFRFHRTWGTLLLVMMLALTLSACGSSDDVADAAAPAATPLPPTAAPTAAPTVAPTAAPTATSAPATEAAASDATDTESTDTGSTDTGSTDTGSTDTGSTDTESAAADPVSDPITFVIDPEQSEARFIVNEVLFGNPNTVTGRTNEVSGEIAINLADPPQSSVGEIRINARSLATDNRFRNRSVNRLILQSNRDEYQFITFTPTAIEGLPAAAKAGDTFSFQIVGDLKIRDIVQPTTFDVTVTADSDTQISGLAQTVVQRADFELKIPNVEGVADVTEDVTLELEFVATASE